ncbi:MAG TPA: SH3 domain-containing protein [Tepidisphaeraceae bacterium]|nr:SH3 domain-containing protein [Tepidisphaeraceae bacterium]
MIDSVKSRPRRLRGAILVAVIAGLTAVGVAEQVIVNQDVNVKSDKNPFADPVETVGADTKLEVLGRDSGWIRVRTPGGNVGFISEDDLPPNLNLASVQGNGQASTLSNDAAIRGLQDDAEKYAKGKNLSTAGVEQMIAWGKKVTDNDLIAFGKAGHVGPRKFRH